MKRCVERKCRTKMESFLAWGTQLILLNEQSILFFFWKLITSNAFLSYLTVKFELDCWKPGDLRGLGIFMLRKEKYVMNMLNKALKDQKTTSVKSVM
ncbi:hypothetical protein Phum_PHUM550970 [Pediculus humanus corporis]|uniref:Uncharacterized protein n=1 Tax=Pediculus humanus subsp. corporis TaxID=121224 RepID=E0W0E1_PEDHC|nr:uncharacterized protein Phum_PHUM550970 [Pediculus humanus corporis]EEB19097.1 hypothetical protein Phum_PHUM550970 [Pediculus humanus corporis]